MIGFVSGQHRFLSDELSARSQAPLPTAASVAADHDEAAERPPSPMSLFDEAEVFGWGSSDDD